MAGSAKRPAPHGWNRYAAPAAFLVAVTIAVLLVRSALHHPVGAEPVRTGTVATAPAATITGRTPAKKQKKSKGATTGATGSYATVGAGDTFGTIAAENGTTVAEIERLNPGVASTSLHIGQKIRVR